MACSREGGVFQVHWRWERGSSLHELSNNRVCGSSQQVSPREVGKGSSLCQLSNNRACKSDQLTAGGEEPLLEIGQIAVHKAHLLTQQLGETTTGLPLKY
jgi:hypothetical protein